MSFVFFEFDFVWCVFCDVCMYNKSLEKSENFSFSVYCMYFRRTYLLTYLMKMITYDLERLFERLLKREEVVGFGSFVMENSHPLRFFCRTLQV